MIIVDTNILSEAMRLRDSDRVTAWLNLQKSRSTFTTSITEAELRFGVERLSDGARRRHLSFVVDAILLRFGERILPFDREAARAYASVAAARRRLGRPISLQDAMIAGIALSRGAAIATRNVRDFEGLGIDLVDPSSNH